MPGGSITGMEGQVTWSSYTAAAVHGYTITRTEGAGWALRGFLGASDAFKLAQRPLVFVAPHAKGAWRWPITDLSIADGALTATLGPPLE